MFVMYKLCQILPPGSGLQIHDTVQSPPEWMLSQTVWSGGMAQTSIYQNLYQVAEFDMICHVCTYICMHVQ